ncbi:MAG: hypothetical protein A6F72_00220 [Cycloclasticus sp. symbiont of Poecilosclerida sp. N]|nr:MAG: hypothetical protein A6F72_00220 [Cycloclasticus sp. symbiont of Poecilosclerida sp. N]
MPVLYDLKNRKSLISFRGPDAASFLQGQTTCDVMSLTKQNNLFGALCNPKGRVIALFHLVRKGDTFLMLIDNELRDTVIKRLRMFIFRADILIEDISEKHHLYGATQPLSEELSESIKTSAIININTTNELTIYITQTTATPDNIDIELRNWNLALTACCFPEINTSTSELFIPQMLNMDLLDGINFQKGCYTGQEIIARLHYKGSVKQRLFIYQSDKPVITGQTLYLLGESNSMGVILSTTTVDETHSTGLAVLKTTLVDNELMLEDQLTLKIQAPKYGLQTL